VPLAISQAAGLPRRRGWRWGAALAAVVVALTGGAVLRARLASTEPSPGVTARPAVVSAPPPPASEEPRTVAPVVAEPVPAVSATVAPAVVKRAVTGTEPKPAPVVPAAAAPPVSASAKVVDIHEKPPF
jgi:hypothetical protein